MEICIDFDGTCVTHEFPDIGKDIGAAPVLRRLVDNGHNLILFTMRSNRKWKKPTGSSEIKDVTGLFLDAAIDWFKDNGIKLYGINENPNQKQWTTSPKAYGHLYIDDSSIGCPVIYNPDISKKPFVDWKKIEIMLLEKNIL